MLDVQKIKKDFSMFENNQDLVYLDSGATSLTPDVVVDAMSEYYKTYRATVHRAMYKTGVKADNAYEEARHSVAKLINSGDDEIIFVKSTTNGLNILARTLTQDLTNEDHILICELDHHSNQLPWREINKNVKFDYIELENNRVTFESFKKSVKPNTKIVSLHHVTNVMGYRAPIEEISKYCNEHGIIFVVDGAQGITHEKVDVKEIGCDFYVFSGHKMCGPTGVGVVYGKKKLLQDYYFEFGGDMANKVDLYEATFLDIPVGREAGTPSIAEIIGLGRACEYLMDLGLENIEKHVIEQTNYLIKKLEKIEQVTIYNKDTDSGIVTFNLKELSAHDALQGFANAEKEICIRGGHMCNQLTLKRLGVSGVLRASVYLYNDKNDIDEFIKEIPNIIESDSWMLF